MLGRGKVTAKVTHWKNFFSFLFFFIKKRALDLISKFPSVNILLNPDCSPVFRILSFKPEGVCPVICFVLFFPEKIQESPQSRRPSRELGGQWGLWGIKEVLGVVWEQKMQPQPSIL